MKFQIVCNQENRLRLRFGKYMFNQEQGYGLEAMLLSFDGVETVISNYQNGGILITFHSQLISSDEIIAIVKGYNIKEVLALPANEEQKNREMKALFKNRFLKLAGHHFILRPIISCVFPVSFCRARVWYRASHFIHKGVTSFARQGRLTVETLDATAITASLCYGNHNTSSSIMFMLNLSDLLMEYSNARAKSALAGSLAINISQVWLVKDGEEISIQMKELEVGDVIHVRMGSMIPVDGSVTGGEALVNESTMTGEPLAVHKNEGSTVFAGTVLEEGDLYIEVRTLSSDSRISKIIEMIDTGEDLKASIQSNAERLADGIVPISFGAFFATLLLTGNMTRALSVLMVDFSCAIKLTTPLVILTALRDAAQHQIVVKGGKYLEILSEVDTVVFDKTGTLTNAVPKVSKVISVNPEYDEDEILRIAACLEEHFPHSVAAAIVEEAEQKGLHHPEKHEKVEYIVAHGIASSYEGKRSIIGSRHFVFEDEKVPISNIDMDDLDAKIQNDSAVYLAVEQALVGVICVSDPPREDAVATIEALRKEGIKEIIMITGDTESTARHISSEIGLDKYFAGVLPDEKAKLVQQLKEDGRKILMVGDGINDAPALSCADVSMTLNGSSDIAREVSDIAIHSDSLEHIVYARRLATALMQRITSNYHFIVGFNTSLIGLGISGAITNSTAAWLHNASTFGLAALSTRPTLTELEEGGDIDETA
ncbi:MAG: heavy metal translocating P-type ATPase [Lachnospiraceae bacterium]